MKIQPESKYKFKEGNEIICISSVGLSKDLTIGKKYKVIQQVYEFNSNNVVIIGDAGGIIRVFCSRFTTLKIQRKEKLEKLKIKNR